jgi:hypothetical protein
MTDRNGKNMFVLNGVNRTQKILAHSLFHHNIDFIWQCPKPSTPNLPHVPIGALAISSSNFAFLQSSSLGVLVGEPMDSMRIFTTQSFQGLLNKQEGFFHALDLGLSELGFIVSMSDLDHAFPFFESSHPCMSSEQDLIICSDRSFRKNPMNSCQQGHAQQFIVEISGASPRSAMQFFDWPQIFGLLPLGEQKYCAIWSQMSGDPQSEEKFDESLSTLLCQKGLSLTKIDSIGPRIPISSYHAKKYYDEHTHHLFLGEAAHHLHPVAGQGLNLTLNDFQALIAAAPMNCPHKIARKVQDDRLIINQAAISFCTQVISPLARFWLPYGLGLSSSSLLMSKFIGQIMQ